MFSQQGDLMERKGRKTRERKPSPSEERAKLDLEVFTSLAENAFEFLERSIQDFEKSPRFSVVHFCAALEMLLKARLMREHWSLIVSKVETANRAKFQQGDFVSVTMEQAVARLREVVGLQLPVEACKSFEAAAKHRNKLIHFFHPDLSGNDNARAQIVSEQGRAWFHLHRLLNEWPEFADFKTDIDKAEHGLRQHRKYLKAKFDALEPEIKLLTERGHHVCGCPACGFEAAVDIKINPQMCDWECRVCENQFFTVSLTCPHCDEETRISADRQCVECGEEITADELADALEDPTEAYLVARGKIDGTPRGNCSFCDGHQTVIHCHDKHLCTECFEMTDGMEQCGWCSETNNGDMDGSFYTGCNFCEGYAGHTRDD